MQTNKKQNSGNCTERHYHRNEGARMLQNGERLHGSLQLSFNPMYAEIPWPRHDSTTRCCKEYQLQQSSACLALNSPLPPKNSSLICPRPSPNSSSPCSPNWLRSCPQDQTGNMS